MKRFEITLDDNLYDKINNNSKNKSEFIRQAIIEKLDSKKGVNLVNNNNEILENRIHELETKVIISHEESKKTQQLVLQSIAQVLRVNAVVGNLLSPEKLDILKSNLDEGIKIKIDEIKQQLNQHIFLKNCFKKLIINP